MKPMPVPFKNLKCSNDIGAKHVDNVYFGSTFLVLNGVEKICLLDDCSLDKSGSFNESVDSVSFNICLLYTSPSPRD